MHEDLIKRLREEMECPDNFPEDSNLMREAANVIEQLSNAGSAYGRGWTLGYDAGREESKPRWIPVTERLPEKDTRVIVCASLPEGVHSDFIYEDGHWFVSIGVTHWMPFPEPPKEET